MEVRDEGSVFELAVGVLVVEESSGAHTFEVGRFYATSFCDDAVKQIRGIGSLNEECYVNHFSFDAGASCADFSSVPMLAKAVEVEEASFVVRAWSPDSTKGYFIVSKVVEGQEYRDVALMAYSAERLSTYLLHEVVKQVAIDSPESFSEKAREALSNAQFLRQHFKTVARRFAGPSFGMHPSKEMLEHTLDKDGVLTHRQHRRALENIEKYLVENVNRFRKKPINEAERAERRKAEAEIELLISSIDAEALKRIFSIMTPSQRERALGQLDPRQVAKRSQMTLAIRQVGSGFVSARTTDGNYRLELVKGDERREVHFGRRSSLPVYIIYMIDRYRRQEVDTIDLRKMESTFVDIYSRLYRNADEGRTRFGELWQRYNKQPQIYACFNDIRQSLYKACHELDEIVSPYILDNEYGHLFVEPSHLSIPPELADLTW